MKPKVHILIDTEIIGGPGKGIFQFLKNADPARLDYVLSNFEYPPPRTSQFNDYARSHNINLATLSQRFRFDLSPILQVMKIFRQEGCTLLQSHGYKTHIIAAAASKLLGVPWVAVAHGWTTEDWKVRLYHALDRISLKFPEIAVGVSPKLFDELGSIRGELRRSELILNAVDRDEIRQSKDRASVRESLGLKNNEILLGCFGRLSSEKGQRILLEGLAKSGKEGRELRLVFVGDGPDRQILSNLASSFGIADRTKFTGFQESMGDYYAAIDLLVLPSLSEGLPNVVLEAMTYSKPVLATDVGAVREVLTNNESGWIIPPRDSDAIARKLIEISKDPSLLEKIGKAGESSLYPKFSPKARAERFIALYESLVA